MPLSITASVGALEDFVLKVTSLADGTGRYSGGADVLGKMIGEDVTELLRTAEAGS